MAEKDWRLKAVAGVIAVAAIALAAALPRDGIHAENSFKAEGPLLLRGFTDAPDATAIVGSEYGNGSLQELRVHVGQEVKRGDILAVVSTYSSTETALKLAEARLEKAKHRQESLEQGILVADKPEPPAAGAKAPAAPPPRKSMSAEPRISVAEQEVVVALTDQKRDLKTLEMQRSGALPEEQELNTSISESKSEREHARLKMLKEQLANDLAEAAADVRIKTALVEQARLNHDKSVVRAPLDGMVTHIWTHQGEPMTREVCQIVDMSQVRVQVDLDERLINRVSDGEAVDVMFRGDKRIHKGKVWRISTTVSRMKSSATSGTGTTRLDVVRVEVTLDDPKEMPRMIGREASVTFL